MCNFWDKANMRGLEDCFLSEISRVIDTSRREQQGTQHTEASEQQAPQPLLPPVRYEVVHKPFVFVRDRPSTLGGQLGFLRKGDAFIAGVEHDGWVRTAEPFLKGQHGWTLVHGARLGLGPLLQKKAALPQPS